MDTSYNQTGLYCSKEVALIWALLLTILAILAIIIRTFSIEKHCLSSKHTTSNLQLAGPCCSPSSSSSPPTWDVFLSFYGKDTRTNFTSHLYSALDQAGFLTFIDDPALEKGQQISSALLDAISHSKIFIIVVSENYALSPWCLNELVQILSCKRTEIQVVPVFYYVDPSDVRHQKGSFGKALDGHKKRYSVDMILKWKSALSEIAELSGHHLRKEANENESDTIQEIVGNVSTRACKTVLHLEKYLLGIDSAVEKIYQKLSMGSDDVRALGICGMGGIGKTTIAKAFYNKYVNKFDISCFHENVKQYSQGDSPPLPLLNQLLIGILGQKDFKVTDVESVIRIRKLKQILHSKKALIILDDLDESYQSVLLEILSDLFSAGSRIIITTRDANLLNKIKVVIPEVDVYMVKTIEKSDSLKLFSYHAFRKPVPPGNFWKLSLSFVTYAGGLPLALKVLGSSLLGRTCEFWKAKLEKVQKIPVNGIHEILEMSYDELDDETVKAIFLDMAFFFVGKDIHEAVHVFESCDFFPDVGIQILRDRCLLTIDSYTRTFEMHSLIQDMGRKLGKSTRLFLRGNAWKDLQNVEGKNDIQGLVLDLTASTHGQATTFLLKRMPNLRLFQIIGAPNIIKGNFTNLFPNLRCIRWHSCPWTYIPPTFCPPKLVSFDMPSSKFKILWKGPKAVKQLNSLRFLNVSECREMKRLPEQLGDLKALKKINASYTAIEKLPDSITHLTLLEQLNLSYCSNLEQLPEQLGKMQCLEYLDASYTAIEQVPDSIGLLSRLQRLFLIDCKKLRYVPPSIWNLTSIERLGITDLKRYKTISTEYTGMISLPNSVKNMKQLTALGLRCNVRLWLPKIQCLSSLETLILSDVINLRRGPIHFRNFRKFSLSKPFHFRNFRKFSLSKPFHFRNFRKFGLSELFNLQKLSLRNCRSLGSSLPKLPLNLQELWIYNHISLEQLPDLSSLRRLKHLRVDGCLSLRSISLLPSHLQSLSVEFCPRLQDLPDMSMLKELEELSFFGCDNLKSISLEESFLHVGQHRRTVEAILPNREVAEWFDYKSSGCTVSFDIPPSFGSYFFGLALWVVFTCKASKKKLEYYMRAVITNDMEGTTENYYIPVKSVVGEAQSRVQCITVTGEEISMKSGDRIKVSIPSLLYSDYKLQVRIGEVKVNMIGVHILQDRPSTSVY